MERAIAFEWEGIQERRQPPPPAKLDPGSTSLLMVCSAWQLQISSPGSQAPLFHLPCLPAA